MPATTSAFVETLRALNERSLEVVEQVTSDVSATVSLTEAQTIPMADGSGRWVTLLTFQAAEADEEIQYRVCSPAPDDAPLWATVYDEHLVEQFVDGWNWISEGPLAGRGTLGSWAEASR